MNSKTVIGFGGVFYTLWQVSSVMHYYTSPNGNHYPSYMEYRYSYIQNISNDIEKVKSLYPGVNIDMELKGARSFTIEKTEDDLSPEILKFGKYAGRDVRDIFKLDFKYALYMIDRYSHNKSWQIAKSTPEYVEYINEMQRALDAKIASLQPFKSGKHRLVIDKNPDEFGYTCVSIADGHMIELHFDEIQQCYYNGITYYLPVFKGKAKRLKGKDIEYGLEITETDLNTEYGYCYQKANVSAIYASRK